jgi:hypothetical protein
MKGMSGLVKGCMQDWRNAKKKGKNPWFSVDEKKLEKIWGVKPKGKK